jgi:MFS family permease
MYTLFRTYPHWILFGILCSLFSSPGQTFLVSLFIPAMQAEFDLSSTYLGMLYAIATVSSALILPTFGRLIDQADVRKFSVRIGISLALGCFVLALSQNVLMLFLGLMAVRLMGQGTLTMISTTTMAKYFGDQRGKALSLSSLGHPIGEAALPLLITFAIESTDWRGGWWVLGSLMTLVFIPSVWSLLKNQQKPTLSLEETEIHSTEVHLKKKGKPQYRLSQVLKDPRFYLYIPPGLITPFLLTALFFHHGYFVSLNGWSTPLIASAFVAFAITRAVSSLMIGGPVDKWSARKLFPAFMIPLMASVLCLQLGNQPGWAYLYLGFAGLAVGIGANVKAAYLAEAFGTAHLGAVRGTVGTLVVISTAISPPILGMAIDVEVSPTVLFQILWVTMTLCLIMGILLSRLPTKRPPPGSS